MFLMKPFKRIVLQALLICSIRIQMVISFAAMTACMTGSQYCEIDGLACPENVGTDAMDYTTISSTDRWQWQGTTLDGRPWFFSDTVLGPVKYMYYSERRGTFHLTYTYPTLDEDEANPSSSSAVRFQSGNAQCPDGTWSGVRLYCGHDNGDPVDGCSVNERDDGRYFYWCNNNGTVKISCFGDPL